MASKLEKAVSYIQDMEIEQRISIKRIAKELSISEGTAYHAIKRAERQGLVVTLPRVGTTRIQPSAQVALQPFTMRSLRDLIDANILCGDDSLDFYLDSICISDGSAQDLEQALESGTGVKLCIVGDRPELQKQAAESGAHLLLTGSAKLRDEVRQAAARNNCLVLQSWYSSFHVLALLSRSKDRDLRYLVSAIVKDWMQPPKYLFLDDLIIDSNRIFESYSISAIPVVDNEMRVCGLLNTVNSYSAGLSQRVKNVYTPGGEFMVMQETDEMADAAEMMAWSGVSLILVQKEDRLIGMLTQNDILRFYQNNGASSGLRSQGSPLKPVNPGIKDGKQSYAVQMSFAEKNNGQLSGDSVVSLLVLALDTFYREQNISGTIRSFSYYLNGPVPPVAELTVSVEFVGTGAGHSIVECTVWRESACGAKATAIVETSQEGRNNEAGVRGRALNTK